MSREDYRFRGMLKRSKAKARAYEGVSIREMVKAELALFLWDAGQKARDLREKSEDRASSKTFTEQYADESVLSGLFTREKKKK